MLAGFAGLGLAALPAGGETATPHPRPGKAAATASLPGPLSGGLFVWAAHEAFCRRAANS